MSRYFSQNIKICPASTFMFQLGKMWFKFFKCWIISVVEPRATRPPRSKFTLIIILTISSRDGRESSVHHLDSRSWISCSHILHTGRPGMFSSVSGQFYKWSYIHQDNLTSVIRLSATEHWLTGHWAERRGQITSQQGWALIISLISEILKYYIGRPD